MDILRSALNAAFSKHKKKRRQRGPAAGSGLQYAKGKRRQGKLAGKSELEQDPQALRKKYGRSLDEEQLAWLTKQQPK